MHIKSTHPVRTAAHFITKRRAASCTTYFNTGVRQMSCKKGDPFYEVYRTMDRSDDKAAPEDYVFEQKFRAADLSDDSDELLVRFFQLRDAMLQLLKEVNVRALRAKNEPNKSCITMGMANVAESDLNSAAECFDRAMVCLEPSKTRQFDKARQLSVYHEANSAVKAEAMEVLGACDPGVPLPFGEGPSGGDPDPPSDDDFSLFGGEGTER